jgi:GH24 family phage-related lysozyme (muramidase)
VALKIFTGARGSKFVCDDTRGFGDAIAAISIRADAPVNSCAREERAEPLLKRIGKMSQKQLFECSLNCKPSCNGNCNPANPPGKSTHERRNDGVAYPRWRVGAFTLYWMRGIDVQRDRVFAFIREAAKEGWLVTQTYPGSPNESQHINFRRKPRISLWEFRPIGRGDKGRRARAVIRRLKLIQEPGERVGYLPHKDFNSTITAEVQRAIKRFQRDHHIKDDGQVGLRTWTLLKNTARRPPSRLDREGIEHLIKFEGEILHLYDDPAGFATFGVGHLIARKRVAELDAATRRKYGTRENPIARDRARRLSRQHLDEDVARFERAVRKFVPVRWLKSHDRFNAFVSLAFNLGEEILTPGAPLRSVGQALRGSSVSRLTSAILLFDKAGTPPKPMPGLTRRRKAEAFLVKRNRRGGPR